MSSRTAAHDGLAPVLPHSDTAELAVLGSVLLDNATLAVVAGRLDPTDFFQLSNRKIFASMLELRQQQRPVDLVLLSDELARTGSLEAVGGIPYVSGLADGLPQGSNVEFYCAVVKQKSALRKLIYSADAIREQAFAGQDASAIVEQVRKKLTEAEWIEGKTPLHPITLEQLAGQVGTPIEYVAYPVAFKGMVAILDGESKAAGKTTLLLHAMRSCLRKEIFLNRGTKPVNMLLVSEENPRTLGAAVRRADLGENEIGIHILPRAAWAGIPWPRLVQYLEQLCRELQIGWLIIDTFYTVAGLGGDKENNAGDVDEAVGPVRDIAGKLDIPVTLTRHERKSGGDIGQSGRGSSALTGACDVVLQLKRLSAGYRPEMRQLEVTGRIDPDKLTIELSLGRYISHEHSDARTSTAEEIEILDAAIQSDPARSLRELATVTGINKNRIAKVAARKGWQKPNAKGKPWTRSAT